VCTNIGDKQNFSIKPKVVFRKVNTDPVPDDDVLAIKGDFHLPTSTGFLALNPMQKGARIVVTGRNGDTIVDIALPPGAFGARQIRRGWKTNSTLTCGSIWTRPISGSAGSQKLIVQGHEQQERAAGQSRRAGHGRGTTRSARATRRSMPR
jgi:hypothetical protein